MANFPAAVRLSRELQRRIERGIYVPESWLPTERQLALEFDVSRPVVREALADLSESGLVVRRPGCRPRVSAIRASSASAARVSDDQGATGRTIAAVLPQHPTYFSAHAILRGISSGLQGSQYRPTVIDTHPGAASAARSSESTASLREQDALDRLGQEGIAGVIIWHLSGAETEPALRRLNEAGTPVVFVDRYPAGMDCDYVGVDNRSAMCSAVEHLIGMGHRRIGYITSAERITTVIEREAGYRDALMAAGIPFDNRLVVTTPERDTVDALRPANRLYSLSKLPTAVAVLSDFHAFAFIRHAHELGWRVPDDVSIVGFDDIESYSPHPAVLTTIHQPFFEMGQRAAQLLVRRLQAAQEQSEPNGLRQHILLPTSLQVRTTCRPPEEEAGAERRTAIAIG